MTFGAPEWLWGLLLIPPLIALFMRAERRGYRRLQEFVSARLLPQLAGTVNRPRRIIKFALLLLGLSLAVVSLAQPRWGYTFQDVKRKGLDLLIAVDTSRSMLSNDVQPNRLERVKLAVQDLINELQGDRVGLIAFAGRAFLQAPLTIDYDAVVEAINDLDTKTIPEGGTNISSAIALATQSFGKSATGNRALIIFTDGEDLSGDADKDGERSGRRGRANFHRGRRNTGRLADSHHRRRWPNGFCKGLSRPSRQIKIGRETFARNRTGHRWVLYSFGKWAPHDAASSN